MELILNSRQRFHWNGYCALILTGKWRQHWRSWKQLTSDEVPRKNATKLNTSDGSSWLNCDLGYFFSNFTPVFVTADWPIWHCIVATAWRKERERERERCDSMEPSLLICPSFPTEGITIYMAYDSFRNLRSFTSIKWTWCAAQVLTTATRHWWSNVNSATNALNNVTIHCCSFFF